MIVYSALAAAGKMAGARERQSHFMARVTSARIFEFATPMRKTASNGRVRRPMLMSRHW
jgi:hypothetical protein